MEFLFILVLMMSFLLIFGVICTGAEKLGAHVERQVRLMALKEVQKNLDRATPSR